MKTYVLYHAHCPDGFGAAWAAWMALGYQGVEYIPCAYGRPVPEMEDGSRVFIVDFSFSREELLALNGRMASVLVLDHHQTAQAALEGLAFACFDMSRSGAVMTWEHFFPKEPVPPLLRYVQDRDLWQWLLSQSREVNAGLWKGTPRTFEWWLDQYKNWYGGAFEELIGAGKALAFYDEETVAMLCKRPQWQRIGPWEVPVVNSPVLQSEIGHLLLEQHEKAPFAAVYCDNGDGQRVYSLRARQDDFDVSVVAKAFGGGGHRAAAGFKLDTGLPALLPFPEKNEAASGAANPEAVAG